jgi:putative drug exporter of the RND superfamily
MGVIQLRGSQEMSTMSHPSALRPTGRTGSRPAPGPAGPDPAGLVPPRDLLGRAGLACYRRRWPTVAAWVAVLACLITLWLRFGAAADNNFGTADPGQTLLNAHFHRASGDALTLAIRSRAPVTTPAVRGQVTAALIPFRRAAGVSYVTSPYDAPGQVARSGHIAYATVQFAVSSTSIPGSEATALINDARAASGHGVTFSLGGDVVDLAETPYGGPTDGIGTGAAAIVLLLAFGSVLAMGLPLLTALFGIGTGLALIALIGHVIPAPSFSPIVASMIGLGVGVDYALFLLTRFREALREQPTGAPDPESALVTTMRTAGRSVLTAGTTVAIGLLGLLVLRQSLLNGVAVAGAVTVVMTVLAALTLLPALLGFTGTRLARPSRFRRPARLTRPATGTASTGTDTPATSTSADRPVDGPRWAYRWAAVVQRWPVVAAAVSAGLILLLAAPGLGLKLSMPDESAQARGTMGYASYATMAAGFGPGFDAPLIVAVRLPAGAASGTGTHNTSPGSATHNPGLARLASALRRTSGIAAVTAPVISPDHRAALLIADPTTGEQSPATNALVNRLNETVLPGATAGTGLRAYLTGPNAANVAFTNVMGRRLPWLVAIVVAVSMILLTVVFRSVTVAVKAAVMNLLSISAAYGVLVLVTQDGWLRGLFGFPERMPVTTWVPVFLFVILFGLSMDYEVFLISRMREAYDATGDNATAVAAGLARSARVITAAAAIMIVVFLSFVLGANVSVKQVGLGLAVAVLIDATLVRLVLVPAVMELLGRANWWLPSWLAQPLARLLPGSPRYREPVG